MLLADIVVFLQESPDMPLRDVEFFRGDSFPIRVIIKQNGEAIDLTGCRIDLAVSGDRNPVNTAAQIFQVEAFIDPDQENNTGFLSFVPTHTQTDADPGQYWYGIQTISTSNHVRSTEKFRWTLLQDIPKRLPVGDWDEIPDWDTVPDWDKVPGQE